MYQCLVLCVCLYVWTPAMVHASVCKYTLHTGTLCWAFFDVIANSLLSSLIWFRHGRVQRSISPQRAPQMGTATVKYHLTTRPMRSSSLMVVSKDHRYLQSSLRMSSLPRDHTSHRDLVRSPSLLPGHRGLARVKEQLRSTLQLPVALLPPPLKLVMM